jgi:hypothetical protein
MSAIGYSGKLEFGPSKSDGTPRMFGVARLNDLAWHPRVSLSAVSNTHGWFKKNDARASLAPLSTRVRTVRSSAKYA